MDVDFEFRAEIHGWSRGCRCRPPRAIGGEFDDLESLAGTVADLEETVANLERTIEDFKRENEREHEAIRRTPLASFARNVLRVRHSLQRTIDQFDWDADSETRLAAIVDQFDEQFTAGEIRAIDPEPGVTFEYGDHEVVGREPAPDFAEDEIVRVERRGFALLGRALRPAQVPVATGEN